ECTAASAASGILETKGGERSGSEHRYRRRTKASSHLARGSGGAIYSTGQSTIGERAAVHSIYFQQQVERRAAEYADYGWEVNPVTATADDAGLAHRNYPCAQYDGSINAVRLVFLGTFNAEAIAGFAAVSSALSL